MCAKAATLNMNVEQDHKHLELLLTGITLRFVLYMHMRYTTENTLAVCVFHVLL